MEKIDVLFCYKGTTNKIEYHLPMGCVVKRIKPSLIGLISGKVSINEYLWKLITMGNYTLYSVLNECDEVVHKSAKIGKCYKFMFLGNKEFEIGPCYTLEKWRGRGIYPFVLKTIIEDEPDANYYMFVNENNTSSIRGVEKAGFHPIGLVKRHSNGIWRIL